ncbi:MAG: glycosyltransferase family A protein [Armatimonadota bacterium]|nr:glycosyltransferase family A protein [Armatimonadota bacterium]
MSDTPIVSVIMPVYNGAKYLREAIDSVLSQSCSQLELIAVNDGSTDSSGAVLDWYARTDDRVRVFHQKNQGVVAALNKGLAEARGKYVARMDSDDICARRRLAKQVALMESRPEVGVCGTGWSYLGRRGGAALPVTDDKEIRAAQMFWPCIAHPTAMMRRELIAKHDLYYNTEFKQAEDYEFWLRFSRHCKMVNIPEPLLHYRVCGEQATSKHESEVREWSSFVHRQAIMHLGIEPSEEDLELHRSLAGSPIPKSLDYVQRAEAWLLKLANANETKHVYDVDALRRVFFQCWYSFCSQAAEMGLWTWPIFRESALSYGFNIPVRYCVSFVVRYALRDRARAAYYRLSKFDTVWRMVAMLNPRTAKSASGDPS